MLVGGGRRENARGSGKQKRAKSFETLLGDNDTAKRNRRRYMRLQRTGESDLTVVQSVLRAKNALFACIMVNMLSKIRTPYFADSESCSNFYQYLKKYR